MCRYSMAIARTDARAPPSWRELLVRAKRASHWRKARRSYAPDSSLPTTLRMPAPDWDTADSVRQDVGDRTCGASRLGWVAVISLGTSNGDPRAENRAAWPWQRGGLGSPPCHIRLSRRRLAPDYQPSDHSQRPFQPRHGARPRDLVKSWWKALHWDAISLPGSVQPVGRGIRRLPPCRNFTQDPDGRASQKRAWL